MKTTRTTRREKLARNLETGVITEAEYRDLIEALDYEEEEEAAAE